MPITVIRQCPAFAPSGRRWGLYIRFEALPKPIVLAGLSAREERFEDSKIRGFENSRMVANPKGHDENVRLDHITISNYKPFYNIKELLHFWD
ncbi:MAG: hypothetical protein IJK62_03420 [Bacteroidales bacterium]|nr:hypothetical protein [Bacteroidales bacterium]